MKLSIVIVNFNVKQLLENCLQSVVQACKNIDAEIFVIDNASTDGSQAFFKKKFSSVHFKWNKINVGFAKANNSVLPEVSGDYILFLNPDTIVPPDCFEKCMAFFSTHHDCGALGVRMVDGQGNFLKESKRGFPHPMTSLYKMMGLHKLFPRSRKFAKYYEGHLSEKENNPVAVLSGAFMLLSKATLNKVKGFDESYFMYGEDIDLSCNITKAGFKNYYFADTTITHFKGESTEKKSAEYSKHFYGSMKIFVRKYYAENKITMHFICLGIDFKKALSNLKRVLSI